MQVGHDRRAGYGDRRRQQHKAVRAGHVVEFVTQQGIVDAQQCAVGIAADDQRLLAAGQCQRVTNRNPHDRRPVFPPGLDETADGKTMAGHTGHDDVVAGTGERLRD